LGFYFLFELFFTGEEDYDVKWTSSDFDLSESDLSTDMFRFDFFYFCFGNFKDFFFCFIGEGDSVKSISSEEDFSAFFFDFFCFGDLVKSVPISEDSDFSDLLGVFNFKLLFDFF